MAGPQLDLDTYVDNVMDNLFSFVPGLSDLSNDAKAFDSIKEHAKEMLLVHEQTLGGNPLTVEKALEPDFLQQFTQGLVAIAVLDKKTEGLEGDEKSLADALENTINQVMDFLKNDEEFQKELKGLDEKLKNDFKPQERAEKKNGMLDELLSKFLPEKLQQQLKGILEKFKKELEKTLDKDMKDAPKMPSPDDVYTNLFGMINSAVAGGHQVPIQGFVGNGLGFNDWSPYDGNAPIESQNSLKDTQFGDSLGLNASTESNYDSIGMTLVDDLLGAKNMTPEGLKSKTPRLEQ